MNAQDAFNTLKPEHWAATSPKERLAVLEQIQLNMMRYAEELAAADTLVRNELVGENVYTPGVAVFGTVGLIGGTVAATTDLYQSILKHRTMTAKTVTPVGDGTYDLEVFPQTAKDRMTAGKQRGHLRVKGEPRQANPLEQPAGVIAVLGAGNYSASIETIKALFWENKAAIHKPHHLNEATDAVWQKVFAPLVERGALAFCDSADGRALTQLPGLTAIYFTGGSSSAKAIMAATDTPLISECGGNNPCIVVPGDRPWTEKEIAHQAVHFVTLAKLNGGAVCGRAQTLVTSRNWPQREQFLDAIRKAFVEDTPAISTYYPGSDKVADKWAEAYPEAEMLAAENGKHVASNGLLITGSDLDGFAANHEAFCQVIVETPLDVSSDADAFLHAAVNYCNEKLLGSLAAMVVIDDDTRKAHQPALDQAISNLKYGAVAVNAIPALVFTNPYLIWGGNEEGQELVSGHGNFGNLLGYENVEKAVLYDGFVSMTHFLYTKKQPFDSLMAANARFMVRRSWTDLARMTGTAVRATMARKDF
jgi:acyl-CoA reductase-like NAD-dependent aldehyde dehydrogenase